MKILDEFEFWRGELADLIYDAECEMNYDASYDDFNDIAEDFRLEVLERLSDKMDIELAFEYPGDYRVVWDATPQELQIWNAVIDEVKAEFKPLITERVRQLEEDSYSVDLDRLSVVRWSRNGPWDLNAYGKPCETLQDLRGLIHGLHEQGVYNEHVRDRLLAELDKQFFEVFGQ